MDTPLTDSQALPPGTRIEEFAIERVLGAGGFGITYLARDVSLNRQVVIKENLPAQFAWRDTASGTVRPRHTSGGDADDYHWSMNNFLREAETLASLDHPGIVRVLRKFEANGTAYFVMPFVEGLALDTLIEDRRQKNSPFSEEELRGLLERMLDALAYMHDRGIYHRDIKPGNILITIDGIPTLIDFGSARQRLSERSMTVIESAGYTPFEQLQSRGNVGPWSDLYALGATLVKAITFETLPKAADRVMEDPWPGLAENPKLSGRYSLSFLNSIEQAVAPSPAKRWQDARQWKHYLQNGMPTTRAVEIPPPQPISPAAEWTRGDSELNTAAPALWNPSAAGILSHLLLPVFGVFLHARNARAMGLPDQEKKNMWWLYGMIAYFVVCLTFSGLGGLLKFYLPVLLAWYFTCGRKQEKYVKEKYGDDYPRKSFLKPIAITIASIFGVLIFTEGLRSLARDETGPSVSGEVAIPASGIQSEEDPAMSYFNRGLKFANGDGVTQNHEEAVKWYRKAAEMGHLGAMNNLAVCYQNGEGVPKDQDEAVKWYCNAAEQGLALSQRNLAYIYLRGEGVSKSIENAVAWFRKAAEQGDADSQYMFGFSFAGVEGFPANRSEMFKWIMKAAEQGHAGAQKSTGDCYASGEGVAKDAAKAVSWYQKAAEQGNAEAQDSLGDCYRKGEGVTEDEAEAVKWHRMAAEQGNSAAQNSLGVSHQYGIGVAKDAVTAVSWYRKAAEQGAPVAQRNLGDCYWTGDGVAEDKKEAAKWYRMAAEQGNSAAQNSLGVSFEFGLGVAKDAVTAVSWYRKAAEQGNAEAQRNLGDCYWRGEGVTKDEAEAVKWFRMAGEQGDSAAQNSLGVCHQYGMGVAKDALMAVSWYRKAAVQGNAVAQRNLGNCYYNGVGLTKDAAEAVKWYRKAVDQGDAWAQNALGDCYRSGEGVAKDDSEAAKWYQKSAEQGNNTAQFNIGYLNAVGEGVPKDLVLAYMWWNLSAVSGDATAKGNLEKVSKQMTAEQIAEAQRLCREWKAKHKE